MLLGIAAVLAGKQSTPTTTRGTFEGKTRSDATNPLRRACWACRSLMLGLSQPQAGRARSHLRQGALWHLSFPRWAGRDPCLQSG